MTSNTRVNGLTLSLALIAVGSFCYNVGLFQEPSLVVCVLGGICLFKTIVNK